MVKLVFRISPIVNLYYHLERGGLSKRYLYAPVAEYRNKVLEITDRALLDGFSFILDQENVHSLIVSAIGNSSIMVEAKENLARALDAWANRLSEIMDKSWSSYIQYFGANVRPNLEEFVRKLEQLAPEIEERLIRTENLLGLRWRKNYVVYIVEPTSLGFKPCGDVIYGEGAAVEAHLHLARSEIVDLVIHELSHSTFDLAILDLMPEKLRTDYEYIDEAIIFLITATALEHLTMPSKIEECVDERSRKVASYAIPFWKAWQERLASSGERHAFEDFLKGLLEGEASN